MRAKLAPDEQPLKGAEIEFCPPAPVHPRPVQNELVDSHKTQGLLTRFYLADFLIGLMLGPFAHFVIFLFFAVAAEWIVPEKPVPPLIWYGPWVFTVAAAVVLFMLLFRRYTYLMVGFAVSTVIIALINLLGLWFGAALSGGATTE